MISLFNFTLGPNEEIIDVYYLPPLEIVGSLNLYSRITALQRHWLIGEIILIFPLVIIKWAKAMDSLLCV